MNKNLCGVCRSGMHVVIHCSMECANAAQYVNLHLQIMLPWLTEKPSVVLQKPSNLFIFTNRFKKEGDSKKSILYCL